MPQLVKGQICGDEEIRCRRLLRPHTDIFPGLRSTDPYTSLHWDQTIELPVIVTTAWKVANRPSNEYARSDLIANLLDSCCYHWYFCQEIRQSQEDNANKIYWLRNHIRFESRDEALIFKLKYL